MSNSQRRSKVRATSAAAGPVMRACTSWNALGGRRRSRPSVGRAPGTAVVAGGVEPVLVDVDAAEVADHAVAERVGCAADDLELLVPAADAVEEARGGRSAAGSATAAAAGCRRSAPGAGRAARCRPDPVPRPRGSLASRRPSSSSVPSSGPTRGQAGERARRGWSRHRARRSRPGVDVQRVADGQHDRPRRRRPAGARSRPPAAGRPAGRRRGRPGTCPSGTARPRRPADGPGTQVRTSPEHRAVLVGEVEREVVEGPAGEVGPAPRAGRRPQVVEHQPGTCRRRRPAAPAGCRGGAWPSRSSRPAGRAREPAVGVEQLQVRDVLPGRDADRSRRAECWSRRSVGAASRSARARARRPAGPSHGDLAGRQRQTVPSAAVVARWCRRSVSWYAGAGRPTWSSTRSVRPAPLAARVARACQAATSATVSSPVMASADEVDPGGGRQRDAVAEQHPDPRGRGRGEGAARADDLVVDRDRCASGGTEVEGRAGRVAGAGPGGSRTAAG